MNDAIFLGTEPKVAGTGSLEERTAGPDGSSFGRSGKLGKAEPFKKPRVGLFEFISLRTGPSFWLPAPIFSADRHSERGRDWYGTTENNWVIFKTIV